MDEEIKSARKEIVSDGYEMSLGEVVNLYRDSELKINPEYQRLFRWDLTRKTRFIESILLGIPVPPIFVFQDADGNWELIDGLQRLSTILEFWGVLIGPEGNKVEPSSLDGTKFLPSLSKATWQKWNSESQPISKAQQLQIKRARLRVEILLNESDDLAKFELFQRLNNGGEPLTQQEVRNCVAVMVNPQVLSILRELSEYDSFVKATCQTEAALEKQMGVELALRFLAFRLVPYDSGLDVHEYLDNALLRLAVDDIDWENEKEIFRASFNLLNDALGEDSFKRWDGDKFKGKFLMSLFEVIAYGASLNLDEIRSLGADVSLDFIRTKSKELWADNVFQTNSGAGVRGTTRLSNLLPFAQTFLQP